MARAPTLFFPLNVVAMPYVETWDQFREAAEALFKARPNGTRLLSKFRYNDKQLVVKVTDDIQCIKFRTDRREDVKRLEKLTTWMLALLTDKHTVGEEESKTGSGTSGHTHSSGHKRERTASQSNKRPSGAQRRKAKKARTTGSGAAVGSEAPGGRRR